MGHAFEEVTDEGVLTWQSQPRSKLNDDIIQPLTNQDYTSNNTFFFFKARKLNLPTKTSESFTCVEEIAYVTHNIERESPVYFKWQLLEWADIPPEVLRRIDLQTTSSTLPIEVNAGVLHETNPPLEQGSTQGEATVEFHALRKGFTTSFAEKQKIVAVGELLTLKYIEEKLIDAARRYLSYFKNIRRRFRLWCTNFRFRRKPPYTMSFRSMQKIVLAV